MKKRIAVGLFFAAGCIAALAGCGSNGTDTKTAGAAEATEEPAEGAEILENGPVELTMWSEAANFDMLNTMIENFKAEHAGEVDLTVNLVENLDANVRGDVLNDVHNAPDLYTLVDDQLTDLVAGGALEPVPNREQIAKVNLEDAVEAATVEDILFAYPMTADNGYFLYYDKRYLSDTDVQTLDGILSVEAANQKLRLEVRNQGPSNVNVASSEEVSKIPAIQAVIAQAEFGKLQRVGNSYWDPFMEFGEMMATGNLKGFSLQEAMDFLVSGITATTVQ